MAGVDKFGAAFAIAFMILMLAFMGGLTPDGESPEIYVSETSTPPVQYTPPETVTTPSDRESLTGFLKYTIRGGAVDSITNNTDENSVTVLLDNNVDGQLTITMTKDAITSFDDGTYFVTIDGEETHDFVQVGQKLTIDFLAGSQEIIIFGMSDSYAAAATEAAAAEAAATEAAATEAAATEAAAAEAAAADKAAADKAAADKAAADKAAADKAAADKAAADKAAADKAAADKAAADKAASMSAEVSPVAGSGAPGCEPNCYDPTTVTISAGGTVTFVNSDTAPHTATSGTPTDGPDGVWDSSLVMTSSSYSVTLDNPGTYDYFCMVHPWMQGTVIVE